MCLVDRGTGCRDQLLGRLPASSCPVAHPGVCRPDFLAAARSSTFGREAKSSRLLTPASSTNQIKSKILPIRVCGICFATAHRGGHEKKSFPIGTKNDIDARWRNRL